MNNSKDEISFEIFQNGETNNLFMKPKDYKFENWILDSETSQIFIPAIQQLYNLTYSKNKIASLPNFDLVEDYGVLYSSALGKFRRIAVVFNGIKYFLQIHFYNRHNGNCFAIRNENSRKNLLQLVLDKYLEVIPDGIRIWHDGKITTKKNLNSAVVLEYVKNNMPSLIKFEEHYGEFIEFSILQNNAQLSFENFNTLQLFSNFLLYSILRLQIKEEYSSGKRTKLDEILMEIQEIDTNQYVQISETLKIKRCRLIKNYARLRANGYTFLGSPSYTLAFKRRVGFSL